MEFCTTIYEKGNPFFYTLAISSSVVKKKIKLKKGRKEKENDFFLHVPFYFLFFWSLKQN